MINPQDYFKVTWHEGNSGLMDWIVPENLPYFEGHFPGNPVLAAIAIIDFSLVGISMIMGRKVSLLKMKKAKFTDVIRPHYKMEIEFTKEAEQQETIWKINWLNNKNKVAELVIEIMS